MVHFAGVTTVKASTPELECEIRNTACNINKYNIRNTYQLCTLKLSILFELSQSEIASRPNAEAFQAQQPITTSYTLHKN
jgi:hypothetical protein